MPNTCPICDHAEVSALTGVETFPYDGIRLSIDNYEYSACASCGEEFVTPTQARRNEVRFADAKRVHDKLLTAAEISGWRDSWNLTQAQAAEILGGGANAFSKYERGEVIQSRAMDLLIRVADNVPGAFAYLAELANKPELARESGWEEEAVLEMECELLAVKPANVVVLQHYRDQRAAQWEVRPEYAYASH